MTPGRVLRRLATIGIAFVGSLAAARLMLRRSVELLEPDALPGEGPEQSTAITGRLTQPLATAGTGRVGNQQSDEDVTGADWSSELVTEIEHQLQRTTGLPPVHSVAARSPDEVEIIFWAPTETPGLRGIRLSRDQVRGAGWRIRESTIGELAFNIIHLGIDEPRALDEFSPPDPHGVRWLDIPPWLAEIS
jgi:hypothetical protein